MQSTFQKSFFSRGEGSVANEVAALYVQSLQDVDDGLLQGALPWLVHRVQWGVTLGTSPPGYSRCLACFFDLF